MEERFRQLEETEVTRLYDEIYQGEQARTENRVLAEELLGLSPESETKEKWYFTVEKMRKQRGK